MYRPILAAAPRHGPLTPHRTTQPTHGTHGTTSSHPPTPTPATPPTTATEKMRGEYGKLAYLLQDAVSPRLQAHLQCNIAGGGIRTGAYVNNGLEVKP